MSGNGPDRGHSRIERRAGIYFTFSVALSSARCSGQITERQSPARGSFNME